MATEPNPAPSNGVIPPSNNEDYLEVHGITQKLPVREVRAAVSMVGGTSLAIYENGVAQELFRMVHGQGIYGVLKWLTHSHAYIDILSGTSAGGMNTIFLSTALTVGTDFLPTKARWIKVGGIDDLLQNPNDKSIRSLFRGNSYYYDEIYGAFSGLTDPDAQQAMDWTRYGQSPGIASGWTNLATREYRDLDLFVTGTYLRGQNQTYFDARTKPLYNLNYRGVFHLKHRAQRGESHFHSKLKDPSSQLQPSDDWGAWPGITPDTEKNTLLRRQAVHQRLARIARTTSSLPAVFEPSQVSRQLMNGIINLPAKHDTSYMGDGGYLNNRPINLVLDAILSRPAEREVVRKIFFVEPSPGELQEALKETPQEPSALQHLAIFNSVSKEQSISNSLQQIHEHNRKVEHIQEARVAAQDQVLSLVVNTEATSLTSMVSENQAIQIQLALWQKIRLQELCEQMVACWESSLGLQNYGGIIEGDDPQALYEAQQQAALPLRVIQTRLLTLMEKNCLDLQGTAPAPSNVSTPFYLSEVDATWLKRKIRRAITEIYGAMYPQAVVRTEGQGTENGHHTPINGQSQRELYDQVHPLLRELHHLTELAEIIEENVGLVVSTLAESAEYKKAVEMTRVAKTITPTGVLDPLDEALNILWQTLVGCLQELLRHLPSFLAHPIPPLNETEAQRKQREREDSNFLQGIEDQRQGIALTSYGICKALREDAIDSERHSSWRIEAQTMQDPSLVSLPKLLDQIDLHVNEIVRKAAIVLVPALKIMAREKNVSLSLLWALNFSALSENSEKEPVVPTASISRSIKLLDVFLYPVERASNLQARNPIEVVQISPRDVKIGLSKRNTADKISGDILGNLGSFLKSSWRANDIMWGRLDGSGAIADTLWDRGQLRRLLNHDSSAAQKMLDALDNYVLRGLLPGVVRPNAPRNDHIGGYLENWYNLDRQEIKLWLENDYKSEPAVSDQDNPFRLMRDWLLRRHQIEILMEEVPDVVTEALVQQSRWQGRSEAPNSMVLFPQAVPSAPDELGEAQHGVDKKPPQDAAPDIGARLSHKVSELASRLGARPDPPARDVARIESHNLSQLLFTDNSANNLQPSLDPQKVEAYFLYNYQVGAENVAEHIPPLVSLRQGLTSILLVLQLLTNAVATSKNPASKTLLSLLKTLSMIFGIFYGFVTTLTLGNRVAAALHAAAITLITLIVVISLFTAAHLPPVFYLVAVVIFLAEVVVWRITSPVWPVFRNILASTALLIFTVAVCGLIYALKGSSISPPLPGLSSLPTWTHLDSVPLVNVLFISTVVMMFILGALKPGGQGGIITYELVGDVQKARNLLFSWGAKGRIIAAINLALDFPFIVVYSLFLSVLCTSVAQGLDKEFHPNLILSYFLSNLGMLWARLALVAGVLDALENVGLGLFLSPLSKRLPFKWAERTIRSAQFFAIVKFALIIGAVFYFLVGGAALVIPNVTGDINSIVDHLGAVGRNLENIGKHIRSIGS